MPSFNVNDFRTALGGDGARPNLFEVTMNLPNFAGSSVAAQKLSFMCTSSSIPGSTIGQVSGLFYFGREVKIAGNRTYADWSVQIINDEDFLVRNALEKWHYYINGPTNNQRQVAAISTTTGIGSPGYAVNASVKQYAKVGGKPIKQYDFIGLWPTDIAPIELAWGTNDQLEEFGVTWAYQYWTTPQVAEPNPTSGPVAALVNNLG
jgi:hypothetical protein